MSLAHVHTYVGDEQPFFGGGGKALYAPDDLPLPVTTAGGTAGEYVRPGKDPVGGGRPRFGNVADDPAGN